MEKHFANYNQSLALKELGFDEPCFGWHHPNGYIIYAITTDKDCIVNAPLKSQVFEWFRGKYQIEVTVACFYSKRLGISYEERLYHCHIIRDGLTTKGPKFKNYYEAESACIDKLIEIVENNLDK